MGALQETLSRGVLFSVLEMFIDAVFGTAKLCPVHESGLKEKWFVRWGIVVAEDSIIGYEIRY